MLTEEIKDSLKANWGDKANAMSCYTEAKFILGDDTWYCYVYAIDPIDGDTIACILPYVGAIEWSLKELYNTYDPEGEYVKLDPEFRRAITSELYKKLREGL